MGWIAKILSGYLRENMVFSTVADGEIGEYSDEENDQRNWDYSSLHGSIRLFLLKHLEGCVFKEIALEDYYLLTFMAVTLTKRTI